jgi:hypothetical protein
MITDAGYVLTLAPPNTSLFVGDSARITATLRDADGDPVAATFSWSVDNAAVAQVDANGTVRAVGPGTTTVRVTARGETASAALLVAEDQGHTLSVSPTGANLFVDGSQRFAATLKDRNGNTIPATPEWTTSNSSVASVDASGLVRGRAPGSATIQAKVGDLLAGAAVTVSVRPPSVVLVGAGDIASCSSGGDEATARLLDDIPGTVFTAGDNAYNDGTATEYTNCYGPSWGRHKARTRPAPGNHEYNTPSASGYFGYFGSAAGERGKGYYSYDIGAWHIIVLNSNLMSTPGSPQETWLRADLADHNTRCTLAYWHHPRFSSGPHGNSGESEISLGLWQALYDAGADVILAGHDHTYERFAPQTPAGELDMSRGLRQFVVGTGGAGLYAFIGVKPNSEVRSNASRGVLKLTLYPDRYDWQFVPASGGFTDAGSASCH